MAQENLLIPNTQLGMKVKLFQAWDIFGGFEHKGNKNIFVVKQTNTDDQEKGVRVSDFVKYFVETINQFFADTKSDTKPDTKVELKIDWPPGFKAIADALQVYVNEVYLKIETQDGALSPDDKSVEYAFWIGIKLSDDVKTAINGKEPFYAITDESLEKLKTDTKLDNKIFSAAVFTALEEEKKKGHAPVVVDKFLELIGDNIFKGDANEKLGEGKDRFLSLTKFEVPAIFKIIQLEDLFIKIWDTTRPEIIKELQLESLIDKYSSLKLISDEQDSSTTPQTEPSSKG